MAPLTKSLGATNLCLRYAPAKCGKFDVHNVSFDFATAISKFDTSLSYHIVRKRIAKVTDFLSFCPFGISIFLFSLSELVCTKYVFYPILLFPLLTHPKLLHLWSVTDRQTNFNTPCYLSYFIPLSARGPTRRRNSTGLAELWGRWPIEQDI